MSPKVTKFFHRLSEILGFSMIDTETGHRMLRQIYRVGEYDDNVDDISPQRR